MSDDRILEFMAQVGEFMRLTDQRAEQADQRAEQADQRAEQTNRNFERLITVMHSGFERVTNQLSAANIRLDGLAGDVTEIKQELKGLQTQVGTMSRRLNATFDQTGRLTEQTDSNALRVAEVEQALAPTNAELHQRLLVLEQRLDKAA